MRRMTVTVMSALLLMCVVPAVGRAEEKMTTSADPAKVALVARYFEITQVDQVINRMLASMVQQMLKVQKLGPEDEALIEMAFLDTGDKVISKIMADCTTVYANAFTLEELESLVAFYNSPVGRSVMVKTQELTPQIGALVARYQPMFEEELFGRLKALDAEASPALGPQLEPRPVEIYQPGS